MQLTYVLIEGEIRASRRPGFEPTFPLYLHGRLMLPGFVGKRALVPINATMQEAAPHRFTTTIGQLHDNRSIARDRTLNAMLHYLEGEATNEERQIAGQIKITAQWIENGSHQISVQVFPLTEAQSFTAAANYLRELINPRVASPERRPRAYAFSREG